MMLSKRTGGGGDQFADYQLYPPDLAIATWDFDNLDVVYGQVAAFFNNNTVCSSWEVLPDPTCPPLAVPFSIAGRPCVNGVFSTSGACALAGCSNGTHIWQDTCVRNPSLALPSSGFSVPIWIIIAAIAGVVLLIVIVVVIVVVARRKGKSESGYQYRTGA
jgi:hypothetical protein